MTKIASLGIEALRERPTIDFVLATATKTERDAMCKHLAPLLGNNAVLKVAWDQSTYYLGKCGQYNVAIVMSDAGSGGTAGSTQVVADAIQHWNPNGVIAVGFCLGKDKKEQILGDVLVSKIVFPYDPERIGETREIPRGPSPEAGTILLDRAKNLAWRWRPRRKGLRGAIFGPILSGSKLVDSEVFKAGLWKKFPEAVGCEMEGAGLYSAAHRKKVEWLIVKGICDWGVKKTKRAQPLAARNAASFVTKLLSQPGLERTHFTPATLAVMDGQKGFNAATAALTFGRIRDRIRSAENEQKRSADDLEATLRPYNRVATVSMPGDLQPRVELLVARNRANLEAWLNAYNDGCAAYLSGEVDRSQFRLSFGAEILQLVERPCPIQEILESAGSAYQAIEDVYRELKESPSALPVIFPAAAKILDTFRAFKIGVNEYLPIQSLLLARSSWSKPEQDNYQAALEHLGGQGYVLLQKTGPKLTSQGYRYLYQRQDSHIENSAVQIQAGDDEATD
jgi:nucleoside phosphorylase